MIKNKVQDIKFIFKTYLKTLKYFKFSNKFLFYKILEKIIKNNFLNLF